MSKNKSFRTDRKVPVEPNSTIVKTLRKLERELRKENEGFTLTAVFTQNSQLEGLFVNILPSPINSVITQVRIEHDPDLQVNELRVVYLDTFGYLATQFVNPID